MKKPKNMLKKVTTLVFVAVSFFCCGFSASAEVACEYYSSDILTSIQASAIPVSSDKLNIKAKSVILMEPNTGKILYENSKDEKTAPASITKIMSLLLIIEAIESEKISLETKVAASEYAASMGGSQIWLEEGEIMTVDELLRASVIASANDATVALAEAVAGSEETFVDLMNKKAKELGMKNTNFVNACGLDADGHLTTAYDVAVMASALIKHKLIKKYSTVWMDALRDGKSELVNTNKLIRYYDGATGLKTGTTSKAGCCVAATAEKNGMELVAVVMGSESSSERFSGAKKLLDYGFANWSFVNKAADISKLNKITVKKGMQTYIVPKAEGVVDILLEKGKDAEIKQLTEIEKEIEAPVCKGDIIGKVKFVVNDEVVGELPVISDESVEKITFFNVFNLLLSELFKV